MRIAIVDDLSEDRDNLADLVISYLHIKKMKADVFRYADGVSFLREFRRERFTVVFLDILMRGLNGMEVARRIREQDASCLLIFVTNSNAFALEGYWVKAFHYLVKPYSTQEFAKVMERCCCELDSGIRYIELKEGRVFKKVLLRDIWYADMQGHYVQLHTVYGLMKSRLFFEEIEDRLQDQRFVKCYRNVIVNMDQVQSLQGMDFVLKCGERVPIQKKNTRMCGRLLPITSLKNLRKKRDERRFCQKESTPANWLQGGAGKFYDGKKEKRGSGKMKKVSEMIKHRETEIREDKEQINPRPWEGPYLITLDLEDGTSLECEALASFTASDKNYIALIPAEDNGEGTVYLYRVAEGEDDSVILENIEDDMEYQEAALLFEEIFSGEGIEADSGEEEA